MQSLCLRRYEGRKERWTPWVVTFRYSQNLGDLRDLWIEQGTEKIILTASVNSNIFKLKLGFGYKIPMSEYELYCEEKVSESKKTIKEK